MYLTIVSRHGEFFAVNSPFLYREFIVQQLIYVYLVIMLLSILKIAAINCHSIKLFALTLEI